jgi:large subunit ribosomal protein L4
MVQVDVLNIKNNPVDKIELPDDIFGAEVKKGVLHEVVRNYLANQRQGTASTKTRGLVSGGGRKPWRQKHTGRARAGSIRSPLWKGGGTVFGPMPRDYSYRLPKKVKWAALGAALSAKFADGEIVVVDELPIVKLKTKDLVSLLKGFGLENVLIILPDDNKTIRRAARNIPNVDIAVVGRLNVYNILLYKKLLMTRETVKRMKEVYLE